MGVARGFWGGLMEQERGRPVPLKHAKTSDNFNEKFRRSFHPLSKEDIGRDPLPLKTLKIWPLRNY